MEEYFPIATAKYNDRFNVDCSHIPSLIQSGDDGIRGSEDWAMTNIITASCPNAGGFTINYFFCTNGTYNYELPNNISCDEPTFLPKTIGDQQCTLKGNPVHPLTGNKFQTEIDFNDNSEIAFARFYNSIGENEYGLGKAWSANYFQHLSVLLLDKVVVRNMDGQSIYFDCPVIGACSTDADTTIQLDETISSYLLTREDNVVESYDLTGKLLSITPLSGESQTLSYNATTDLLETVTDAYGRTLNFTYDANDRLETVTDPDGEIYTYTYDANDNLTTVIYPDETPANVTDNPTKQYQYNDVNFPNHLTNIIDENGNTFASFGYDTQGRAIFTEHANGSERIDLTYNADGTTTVTDSLGASNTYTYEITFGVPKTSTVSGSQCGSGCSGEGQAQTYDANGFLASRTDFEGNVTTFINNSRGLQESRTEAVGTPEERTITTEWHPDFRLPTKITEPGKETVFTYNTQGRLLSRTEREI